MYTGQIYLSAIYLSFRLQPTQSKSIYRNRRRVGVPHRCRVKDIFILQYKKEKVVAPFSLYNSQSLFLLFFISQASTFSALKVIILTIYLFMYCTILMISLVFSFIILIHLFFCSDFSISLCKQIVQQSSNVLKGTLFISFISIFNLF